MKRIFFSAIFTEYFKHNYILEISIQDLNCTYDHFIN